MDGIKLTSGFSEKWPMLDLVDVVDSDVGAVETVAVVDVVALAVVAAKMRTRSGE